MRTYSRGTLDRWLRAYRARGLAGLMPVARSDTGAVRRHPELLAEAAALRTELPARSSGAIADILLRRHGVAVAEPHPPGPPAPPGPAPRRHRRRTPGFRAL